MNKNFYLNQLQDESIHFIQDQSELDSILDHVGLMAEWRSEITGACIILGDGEYIAVWLTEDSRYYDLSAIYRPLPFYIDNDKEKIVNLLPYYWKSDNEFYMMDQPKNEKES